MTDAPRTRTAGVVLAGGRSERFGSDKAAALWRGRSLVDWSVAALAQHCDVIFVSGRDHPAHVRVPDRPEPGLGPLGGLAGALFAAKEQGRDRILSLPCDTPELPAGLLAILCAQDGAAFVESCPVIGVWPVADGARLESWLASGKPRAMRAWTDEIGAIPVSAGGRIVNVNRPADLAHLDRR